MQKVFFTVIVFCLFALGSSAYASQDKDHWLGLLDNKNYSILEQQLGALQKQYEDDASKERELLYALLSFENSDPQLESKLSSWLKEKPDSVFANLAYGLYHVHLGWLSRGARWSKDTTSQQFAKMHGHFREARDRLKAVVEKKPKLSIAYAGLVSMAIAESLDKAAIYQEAIGHNPLSSVIRTTYLIGLLPKWGGSFEEIEKFLKETSKLYSQNRVLAIQEGFLEYAHGDALFSAGKDNYAKALDYLSQAIQKSQYTKYLSSRGMLYSRP